MSQNFVLKEIIEENEWSPSSLKEDASFTQSYFYGTWQQSFGRKVKRFTVCEDGVTFCFFQIVFYPLIASKKYGYISYGPVSSVWTKDLLEFLKQEILKIMKVESAVFVRFDFDPVILLEEAQKYFTRSAVSSYFGSVFQPRYEWVISLSKNEGGLLKDMHQKAQYAIRTAEKRGVTVEIVRKNISSRLTDFLELINVTSERNSFSVHDKKYYEKFFELADKSEDVFISIASYEGKILCINLYVVYGNTATYFFGSSSNEHRSLQAPYFALWKSILFAKENGVKNFNFGGVSDPDEKLYKSWKNLTYFKQKFGGERVRHSDFYDVVSSSFWYYLYMFRKWLIGLKHK